MNWYNSVVSSDLLTLPDAITYYEAEITAAKNECRITGNIEKAAALMPGIVEHRFNQLQEIEAILQHLNNELRRLRGHHFKQYNETYARKLTSRDIERYVDHEPDVVAYDRISNQFALVRNQWLGVAKALEVKQWQISNIVKLRCAGMEDASIQ
jgi:hypothetical protein